MQDAVELGFDVAPIEAYVRTQTGRYLDPWYKRLRDAYIATMADPGVTTSMGGQEFLEAIAAPLFSEAKRDGCHMGRRVVTSCRRVTFQGRGFCLTTGRMTG
ncbi:hypothetical protein [Streptomyces sp. CB01635]|uniref:hypothetical protein n=1 Tax=unclassified Streptomyces TaxID=2593676 RepID=UPI001F3FA993|nr:hypothetical protein [Streptomyces sp. CB01635]